MVRTKILTRLPNNPGVTSSAFVRSGHSCPPLRTLETAAYIAVEERRFTPISVRKVRAL